MLWVANVRAEFCTDFVAIVQRDCGAAIPHAMQAASLLIYLNMMQRKQPVFT